MGKRIVLDAIVDDIQKRRHPTKHYVYVIHVSWSDGSVNVIYRRYSRFFDFQMKLLSLFPEEAGTSNPVQRMIPFLPGKKLFGRSQTREVASRRLGQLNSYCRSLVKLPPKISDCDEVIQFFTPTAEDINPVKEGNIIKKSGKDIDVISDPIQPEPYIVVADYKKQQKNEVDLHAGDNVEVFEKNDNGWWFVTSNDNQGWAPATFLSRADGVEDEDTIAGSDKEPYISNNSYKAQNDDEISFETGVVLTVLQKSLDGWWKVSYQDKMGWVPAAFLQVYTGPLDVVASTPTQHVGNVMSVSDLLSRRHGSDLSTNSQKQEMKDNLSHHGTEAKPTPPRRTTVRRTVRKGATRKLHPHTKKKAVEYYTVADFTSSTEDSISFQSGQKVQVIQENSSGWWLVKIGDEEGWAPSSYLEAKEQPSPAMGTLDEETGESSTQPTRLLPPPPLPPLPPARKISSGATASLSQDASNSSNTNAFRPVPIPKSSRISGTSSAFRPVPLSPNNNGRPLPDKPVLRPAPQMKPKPYTPRSAGGSDFLSNAQANLKPANGQSKPPVVSRNNKPGVGPNTGPAMKPPFNKQPSEINELKNQLQSLNTRSPPDESSGKKAFNYYVTTATYENSDENGLSFEEGVEVEVIDENESGWWLVRIGGEEGWAPSTYLEKA